jgi:hypothetical protein
VPVPILTMATSETRATIYRQQLAMEVFGQKHDRPFSDGVIPQEDMLWIS